MRSLPFLRCSAKRRTQVFTMASKRVHVRFSLMKRVHNRKPLEQCQGHFQRSRILGKGMMVPGKKTGVAMLTTPAERSGTTGSNGYRRQEKRFPQGRRERALRVQVNATM